MEGSGIMHSSKSDNASSDRDAGTNEDLLLGTIQNDSDRLQVHAEEMLCLHLIMAHTTQPVRLRITVQ